jgi:hypothetical protein
MRWLLLLCACSPALPLSASDWTTAEEAAELLGLPIEPGHVVVVTWSERAQAEDDGCRREVESPREPIMLAHEVGHALGLDHVDDPANLMHRFVGRDTVELTDAQHDALADEAVHLAGWCP